MNKFDHMFFSRYVDESDTIQYVFHRHIFVILEDLLLWIFFGLVVPGFLYISGAFGIREALAEWQVSGWILLMYFILIYKLCDWYYDVWIATDRMMIDVRWKWFTSSRLYIAYDKIEGVEVRTRSPIHAMIGMSDVIVKLSGDDHFVLSSAAQSRMIVSWIQSVGGSTHENKHDDHEELTPGDREPFEVLVEALSDVVKTQLTRGEKDYVTKAYLEKLTTVSRDDDIIDLRSDEERAMIQNWKMKLGDSEPTPVSVDTHGHHDSHH